MTTYPYLIVGGGMTAAAAARAIREADPAARVALVTAEPHRPYNRPPLSKALWKGDAEDSVWRRDDVAGVEVITGRRIVALDPAAKTVRDERGTSYGYDRLLLATGGAPRRLAQASGRVIYFRTLDDYRRLRELAGADRHFVVLGGGFIGCEIAAALAMSGRRVTMVVPEAGLSARVFPADLSAFVTRYYGEKGVTVRTGEGVTAVADRGAGFRVTTTTGATLDADAVIAGLGIVPETALAEQAGLRVDNGIVVDEQLRTSARDVWAAGDVPRFVNPALGRAVRVEHEDNALAMGRAAGLAMAGKGGAYRHQPFFYGDLFDLGYEAVGDLDARLETVADWKTPFREGVIYYLGDGRVRAVLLWNTWGQVDAARALIAEPGPFTAATVKGRIAG